MTVWRQRAVLFAVGGAGYTALELLWRGRSHWTMTVLGGCVFVSLSGLGEKLAGERVVVRGAAGGLCITSAELLTGLTVNRRFGRAVWDYSALRGNLLGQVCPQYAVLWSGLSIPAMALGKCLKTALKKP